jgi:hypothetical protein
MPPAVDDAHREPEPVAGRLRRSPRSRRRTVLLAIGLLLVAMAVWTVIAGLVAEHRLNAVRADVYRLSRQKALDRATLERDLQRDLDTVRSARNLLGQPGPRSAGWLPLLGRNVDAERAIADASAAALQAGITLSRSTDGLDDGTGGVDLARLADASRQLGVAAHNLQEPLQHLAAQPTAWTLPQVQSGIRKARDQLLGLSDRLSRGAAGLDAMTGVLGDNGRRTILVGLMNNAELRGSGGLLSAYALGSTDHGQLSLHPFRDVNEVAQPPKKVETVPAPDAYRAAYGPYLANSTLWKNVTMSAQGGDSAEVLAAVASTALHVRPDVVVLFDVPAAADIISATGPVTIEGETVSGSKLTRRLLVDAYGNGSLSQTKQDKRRRALTSAASQAFQRLRHNVTSTPDLLQALLDAVSGRHLVVWSNRPDEEQALQQAEVSGQINAQGKDIALAVTNNLGDSPSLGNKLDYYVDRDFAINVKLRPDEAAVTQTLTLHNDAPANLGPYVTGVRHPGEIDELLSLDVAADAKLTEFTRDGVAQDVRVNTADGAKRLDTVLRLSRGATTTYRLSYRLPLRDGHYRLLLVPQALARPASLSLHVRADRAQLGVVSGIDQPVDGRISTSGPWDTQRDIDIPVRGYGGLRGLFHGVAHFWTHKVTL